MRLSTTGSKRLLGATALATAALATVTALSVTTFPAAAASSPPACKASQLVIWLNTTASGTAGANYYAIQFTNVSSSKCSLTGYPGVSGISSSGAQLGSAATRNDAHSAGTIPLGAGSGPDALADTAIAVLRITDVGNYPKAKCGPVTAVGLRVYAPGLKASSIVPFPFRACSKSGPTYLSVESIEGGIAAGA
jgi:hypothetical protein